MLIVIATQSFGQTSISTTQALAPLTAPSLLLNNNFQLDYLRNVNQNAPIIDKMEFRTETDEFDWDRQEYVFRTGFNSFKSRKIQKAITANRINFYQIKENELAEDYLEEQYELLISWYYSKKELAQIEDKEQLLLDQKTVYSKLVQASSGIELGKLVEVEQELLELERRKFKMTQESSNFEIQIYANASIKSSDQLSFDNWITLKRMQAVLESLKQNPNESTEAMLQTLRINEAILDHDFEITESQRILDYLQIKYSNRETPLIKRELSIGAGINIPSKAAARLKINETKLDLYDEELEGRILAFEQNKIVRELYGEFEANVAEHQLILEQEEKQNLTELFNRYAQSGMADPISLLQIKESIVNYQSDKLELEKEACRLYFEILKEKGKINITTPVNYLSNTLPRF